MPKVSVLMSVYNGETHLAEAIDSILAQTFTDFELVIVEDGSTDSTPAILARYAAQDARIKIVPNAQNIGLTRSLNRGLATCSGELIARMDADDIATPQRLVEQVAYMDDHPAIGLLCGDITLINENGVLLQAGKPVYGVGASHHYLTWQLLWTNPIPHMTVMMRKAVLDAHGLSYQPEYNTAEDHELWARLAQHTQIIRLALVWAAHRRIPTSVSHSRREQQLATQYRVVHREYCRLLGENTPASATRTLFEALYFATNTEEDFSGAAEVVRQAFLRQGDADSARVKEDAVWQLTKLARRARTRRQALGIWWRLRSIAPRLVFSRLVWGSLLRGEGA